METYERTRQTSGRKRQRYFDIGGMSITILHDDIRNTRTLNSVRVSILILFFSYLL